MSNGVTIFNYHCDPISIVAKYIIHAQRSQRDALIFLSSCFRCAALFLMSTMLKLPGTHDETDARFHSYFENCIRHRTQSKTVPLMLVSAVATCWACQEVCKRFAKKKCSTTVVQPTGYAGACFHFTELASLEPENHFRPCLLHAFLYYSAIAKLILWGGKKKRLEHVSTAKRYS